MINLGSFPTPNEVLDPKGTSELTTLINYIHTRIFEYNPNKEGGLMIRLPADDEKWEKHKFSIQAHLNNSGWHIERIKTYEFRMVIERNIGFYYEGPVQLVKIEPLEPVQKICHKKKDSRSYKSQNYKSR